ncbi:MAG: hypothetical protein WD267_04875 [Balneolales bacterium]
MSEPAPNLVRSFNETLKNLDEESILMHKENISKFIGILDILTDSEDGLRYIYENIGNIVGSGFFKGTSWEDASLLNPSLVGGTIKVGGPTTLYEIISELRMLAIAQGVFSSKESSPGKAKSFIDEVVINNLDLFFPDASEELRNVEESTKKKIKLLFGFIREYISLGSISSKLETELELICLQRPIVTDRAIEIINTVSNQLNKNGDLMGKTRLHDFMNAGMTPSDKARELSPSEYKNWVNKANDDTIEIECELLCDTLRDTGLSSVYHAILLRKVRNSPRFIKILLGLNNTGSASLDKNTKFISRLIDEAVHPETARSVYGLALFLERNLLEQQPVFNTLSRLLSLELHSEVAESIRKSKHQGESTPEQHLIADSICVLGQPLGVGQGWNPTCQSARGISLWSRHAPGKLMRMVITAATTNNLEMRFEGQLLASSQLNLGLTKEFDYNLDTVSIVLVPHLDRIYFEMMNRAAVRGDDPHKWVNPAMYGHWIPTGFLSAYDYLTDTIKEYDHFLRVFYATHHPDYNGGYDLAYPNPVGIFLTAGNGKLLGFHAVSILRVARNKGTLRIYFLNPNNEGRQKWQSDIKPTVAGNGERAGESSLPFHQFVSRLYAYHYHPSEADGAVDVKTEEIEQVIEIAKSSWGTSYKWWMEFPQPTL